MTAVLHVVTRKGKGYAPAEADPIKWHARARSIRPGHDLQGKEPLASLYIPVPPVNTPCPITWTLPFCIGVASAVITLNSVASANRVAAEAVTAVTVLSGTTPGGTR